MLETARPTTITRTTADAATALAAKIRPGERTATSRWRQVPSRSSAANASPATRAASRGSSQVLAKPSTTSEPAHPVAPIQRPNRVSAGSVLCLLTTPTKTAGATQHAIASSRIRHWASSLTSSKRTVRPSAAGWSADAGNAALGTVSVVVPVIGAARDRRRR